ncbi:MAG: helicase-related protein [Candidatus Hydrothermia bacterium]|jgi:superfamily II DNA/RNA helicase/HKD family nuclease
MDLTFITNENGKTLKERFEELIKDCKTFDCIVGYFYISGFHLIYKSLENAEKIRILVGIGVDEKTYKLIKFSNSEVKQYIRDEIENELSNSDDNKETEEGIRAFIEWIKNKKLEIRAYPSRNLHAKLYIFTFKEKDRDVGRVITGSSNFTQSGLIDNLEFNVELKNRADYEFAKSKFEELWEKAIDVSETYVKTIYNETWLKEDITPYELYLKFLYEYFKDELNKTSDTFMDFLPENFKELNYQKQAVLNAKRILEEYGGVFISDVVGLGKTYICAMLVSQLDGRTMVIAPPSLLSKNNPGSWQNVFSDFNIHADFVSTGKLDEALELIRKREYKNVVIDEAHRFRNETTISYEKLSEICRGKRVILVSATPYNNSPKDVLAQLKLFQNARKSTIPGVPDLEKFFLSLDRRLKSLDRSSNYDEYMKVTSEIAKEIRNKVLKYVMVRRTRKDIETYFKEDLEKNNIKFPQIEDPKPILYQLNEEENEIFMKTVKLLTKELTYARYTPLLYLKSKITPLEEQSQRNLGGFMKVLLVKRLESSFYAFRKSIGRFIESYEKFIKIYKEEGKVFVSKKYSDKIFELLEKDDDEAIQKLIEEGKAQEYKASEFMKDFENHLEKDLRILKEIQSMWDEIKRDPKLDVLLDKLQNDQILKDKKIIIFTESKETADYLVDKINEKFGEIALLFHGSSQENVKDKVIENFDARARNKKDDYKILVSTEVLSEGVNLHRSNIVINYDIPWNPTKLIQRVGRVNRIDTQFDKIYVFNFFPTEQGENEIELIKIARSKVQAFLNLLGGDAAILTEGEPVASHELFDKLTSKKIFFEDEIFEESELKYFKVIEKVMDENSDLFEKIKRLPKKARSSRKFDEKFQSVIQPDSLITFFRKGKLMKFYLSWDKGTYELDFLTAAKIFECPENEKRTMLPLERYYDLLGKNKAAFFYATSEEEILSQSRRGKDSAKELTKILKALLKNSKQLTEDQEEYMRRLIQRLEEGAIPKKTIQKVNQAVEKLGEEIQNPLKVVALLQREISPVFLKGHFVEKIIPADEKREVILSLYLSKKD